MSDELAESPGAVLQEDRRWMEEALNLADAAAAMGEVPIGAVVVSGGTLIGCGHNRRESTQDPTAHAEILAIREASEALRSWRLIDCTLYVTLEPCSMCAGAIVNSRISRCVFGAFDPKAGAVQTLHALLSDERLNHRTEVASGVCEAMCAERLSSFFRAIRQGVGVAKPKP